LIENGIHDISISIDTPTEIACAQLCGLGHYRMKGMVSIQTEQDFDAWMADQEAALNAS